jgi:hypothetical protein
MKINQLILALNLSTRGINFAKGGLRLLRSLRKNRKNIDKISEICKRKEP